jgi:hypothetical protein
VAAEPRPSRLATDLRGYALVFAWMVTLLVTFLFIRTLQAGRGDGFGGIGFLLVAMIGFACVFVLGFLPSLSAYLKWRQRSLRNALVGACVALGAIAIEVIVVMFR